MVVWAVEGVHPQNNCSYQEVLDHLEMTKSNELYYMTRPVKNYKRPTLVSLEVLLYAILDVVSASWKFTCDHGPSPKDSRVFLAAGGKGAEIHSLRLDGHGEFSVSPSSLSWSAFLSFILSFILLSPSVEVAQRAHFLGPKTLLWDR